MATLATLFVNLKLDSAEYESGLTKVIKKTQETATKVGGSLQKVGAQMSGMGQKMTLGVTAPIAAMGLVAVNAASDLEESLNKATVVFGDMADEVISFSQNAATGLGMSQQEALEAAGTFGNLFTSMEMGKEVSANMSQSLVTLAADMGSFNNMDPTAVLEKLRAGIVGEIEPLKVLGVNLNAVAIEAEAVSMGLVSNTVDMVKLEAASIKLTKAELALTKATKEYGEDSLEVREALNNVELAEQGVTKVMEGKTGEISAAAKAQAAYSLIMEQTVIQQGDYINTSSGLANTMKTVGAQVKNLAASFGTHLLPYVQQAMNFVKGLMERFKTLSPAGQKVVIAVMAIAAAIGPLLMIMGSLIGAVGSIIGLFSAPLMAALLPVIAIVAALAAVVGLLYYAWKNNLGGIQDIVKGFIEKVRAWWEQHGEEVIGTIKTLWEGLKVIISTVVTIITGIVQMALDLWSSFWDQHGATIMALVQATWETIKTIVSTVISVISSIFKAFQAATEGDWEKFGEHLRDAWDTAWSAIKMILSRAWDSIKIIISDMISSIIKWFKETDWAEVGINIVKGIANGITSAVDWAIKAIIGLGQAVITAIRAFLKEGSPSKLFAEKVGLPMGLGIQMGLLKTIKNLEANAVMSIKPIVPAMTEMALSGGSVGGGIGSASLGTGAGQIINFNYNPQFSLADEYEAQRVLGPFIEKGVRDINSGTVS